MASIAHHGHCHLLITPCDTEHTLEPIRQPGIISTGLEILLQRDRARSVHPADRASVRGSADLLIREGREALFVRGPAGPALSIDGDDVLPVHVGAVIVVVAVDLDAWVFD